MQAIAEQTIGCVILAGGVSKPELQAATGQVNRALAVVNGKSLLRHVVDAVCDAFPDAALSVVGDVPEADDYTRLPDAGDFVANVFAGVAAHSEADWLLVATSDLPFLTGAGVHDFVLAAWRRANETGAGAVYPIVPVAACYAQFPGIKRTALKLREGEFTGGNLMLVQPAFLMAHRARLADAYAARKSVARLASMLGAPMLCRLLLSQKVAPGLLTLPFLEMRVGALLGGPVAAVVCERPEIATDLDRPSDFAAVGEILENA